MYKQKIDFLSKQARKLDPYFMLVNSKKLFGDLKDELDEAIEALENSDYCELEKELGDIYRVFNLLMNKLEDEKKISIEKIYEENYKKFSTRKTFLEEDRIVTKEEAIDIWNKAKKLEGYSDDRLWNEERIRCD